jgi:hypothetical protein
MNPGIDLQGSFVRALTDLGLPSGIAKTLWLPLPMGLILIAATVSIFVTVWLERKISAAAQQRIGPDYTGPLGTLQAAADGIKLLFKEDITPAKADPILFTLGPAIVVVPVFLSYLIVPFGQNLVITDIGLGIFLWIALSSIAPIGLLMSGYSSNNKYSLLGGLRAAAQSISYEIPMALAVLAVVMMSNSLSTIDIVNQQSGYGILGWNIWRQPAGFLIFWIAALAECERLPFDLPEAEEELGGRVSDRVHRHEVRAFLCRFIRQPGAVSVDRFDSVSGRLGVPCVCDLVSQFAWNQRNHPLVAGDHSLYRHHDDGFESLCISLYCHFATVDGTQGENRPTVRLWLEISTAGGAGESVVDRSSKTQFSRRIWRLEYGDCA